MIGWFYLRYPDQREERIPIPRVPFHIGRYHTNHLVIQEPYVSRFHMSIVEEDGRLVVKDLSSKSGTWVNGRRVETHVLEPGDVIQFHPKMDLSLVFHEHPSGPRTSASIHRAEAQFDALGWLVRNLRSLQANTVLSEISQTLLNAAVELVDADFGMVLVAQEDGTWQPTAIRTPPGQDHAAVSYSHSVIDQVRETGEPVLTLWSPDADPAMASKSMVSLRIHNVICLPLIEAPVAPAHAQTITFQRRRPIGILYLDRRRPGTPFQESDLKVLSTLADEATRSLMFARLCAQVSEQERLQQEIEWAQKVQARFLPSGSLSNEFVHIEGFSRSCREVAGDYFFYTPLGDDQVFFALGDISGKGFFAALLMSLCQGAIHSLTHAGASLEALVTALNRLLQTYSSPSQYTTLFAAILHADGRLEYINAGHPPALLLHLDGRSELLEPFHPIVGILDVAFTRRTTRLRPGDLLLLYSDGVCDRVVDGQVWGMDAWLQWAREHLPTQAERAREMLDNTVQEWSASSYLPDDLTLLLVHYRAPARDT